MRRRRMKKWFSDSTSFSMLRKLPDTYFSFFCGPDAADLGDLMWSTIMIQPCQFSSQRSPFLPSRSPQYVRRLWPRPVLRESILRHRRRSPTVPYPAGVARRAVMRRPLWMECVLVTYTQRPQHQPTPTRNRKIQPNSPRITESRRFDSHMFWCSRCSADFVLSRSSQCHFKPCGGSNMPSAQKLPL